MASTGNRLARLLILFTGAILAVALGYVLFVDLPAGNMATLLGVLLTIGVAIIGLRLGRAYANDVFAPYNVARVSVEGPIVRRASGTLPTRPVFGTADDIVEQIETADADEAVRALVVELNTPGGEVVPSDDIRRAVEDFEGPTIAYATDTCASGGYWIASGCDYVVAREGSIVGSIGVIASRVTGEGLLDRLGLTYERLVAGEYKDAGVPLQEMDEADREYLQGIVDNYYQAFVDRVAEGRDLDEAEIRDTEARVFLGEDALERGLVDELGAEDVVADWIEAEIDESAEFQEFEPERGVTARLGLGAERVAYALGAGISNTLVDDRDATGFEFR